MTASRRRRAPSRSEPTPPRSQPAPAPQPTPPRQTPPRRRPRRLIPRLLLVLFGLALVPAALIVLELVLTLAGAGEAGRYADPFVGFAPGRPLFVERTLADGSRVWETSRGKLAFFNPQRFAAVKAEGTWRAFTLGGSTTAGRPYDHRVAFSEWLRLYLEAAEPGRRHEAINAGADSYASYRVVLLMKELVRHRPDLFVVYTGHNEFLEERTYGHIRRRDPRAQRLLVWLGGLRSLTLAREAVASLRRAGDAVPSTLDAEVSTKLDGWTGLEQYHRDDALRRSVVDHFRFNLHQMAALARDAGAALVFVKPASNLKDFSPFKSEHRPGLAPAARERFASLLAAARGALAADRTGEALAALAEAAKIDPDYAELAFLAGRCHLARGEHEAARAAFVRAKELDVAPLRALEAIGRAIDEVARAWDVPVVDLPALLEADSRARFGHGLPGDEDFLDHVHPDIPVHARIAEEVIEALAERGQVRLEAGWGEARRAEIYRRHLASLDESYYAERDIRLAKVLGWAGKLAEAEPALLRAARVLPDHPEVLLNLGIVYQRTGRHEAALPWLERAAAALPEAPEAHFNLGVVYGELGRLEEGTAALRRAVALRPDYPEAWHDLGVLSRRQGDHPAAIRNLQRALELRPGSARTLEALGRTYRLQGSWAQAEEVYRRALAAPPSTADAGELVPAPVRATLHAGLAAAFAAQERIEEAERELARALEIDPRLAEAHFERGVLRARQGRSEEAMAAYREALALEPDNALAHNNLGILHGQRGEREAARRELARAVELDPRYAEAWLNLGVVHDAAGRPEEALAAVGRAVELEPENARFRAALGMLLYARGDARAARAELERAAAGGADVPPALLAELRRQG